MTLHSAIAVLAISPLLFLSFAVGAQQKVPKTAAGEAGIEGVSPPIACTLSSKEQRARVEEAESELLQGVLRIEELTNGYALWFPAEPGRLQRLAEFVELESQCCAFLDFEIRLEAAAKEVALSLTGPEGTKEVLAPMMKGQPAP